VDDRHTRPPLPQLSRPPNFRAAPARVSTVPAGLTPATAFDTSARRTHPSSSPRGQPSPPAFTQHTPCNAGTAAVISRTRVAFLLSCASQRRRPRRRTPHEQQERRSRQLLGPRMGQSPGHRATPPCRQCRGRMGAPRHGTGPRSALWSFSMPVRSAGSRIAGSIRSSIRAVERITPSAERGDARDRGNVVVPAAGASVHSGLAAVMAADTHQAGHMPLGATPTPLSDFWHWLWPGLYGRFGATPEG
jgi:hypothetical protein